jgi:uncharacterized UBP type Zn finger protein
MRESTNTAGGERGDRAFCEECLLYDAQNVLLRVCLSCGHIGCAEGSPGDHAAAHYAETDHPIAAAIGATAPHWSYPDERTV